MKAADEPKRMGAAAAALTTTRAERRALPLLHFVLFHSFLESSPVEEPGNSTWV